MNDTGVALLVLNEVRHYWGDVVESGELGLVSFSPTEAFLIAGNFALRFLSIGTRIKVSYVDVGANQQLRSFDLEAYLSQRSESQDLQVLQDLQADATQANIKICFARLNRDSSSLWSGHKQWLAASWANDPPGEPMAGALRVAWGLPSD